MSLPVSNCHFVCIFLKNLLTADTALDEDNDLNKPMLRITMAKIDNQFMPVDRLGVQLQNKQLTIYTSESQRETTVYLTIIVMSVLLVRLSMLPIDIGC